jgi:ATP-binding cassette subfamily C (CFTR/MRP) protein 4
LVKLWGELETYITSVERVAEYTHLPLEEDGRTTPPKLWPTEGKIMFHSVSMQYCPTGPLALNQVSFQIRSGQKIGIVGRTGSGKTSLISALFRLFNFDGIITIDDVDIKTMPLNDLRSNISIIPQSPILFLGTLRKNLDPFDEFSDEQIWKVFDELELKKIFDNLPNGIDSPVCEGGSNFSVGQRQLLCLVRSMLRSNKIIVLDEATANVDFETDELIQSIIRRKFQESTVVTVAHRLNTVMDSDKILVMDNGCVAEFDSPYQLLQNPEGLLYMFAKESGEEVLQNFVKIAQRRNQTYS